MTRPLRLFAVLLALLLLAGLGLWKLSNARSWQLFGTIVSRVETDRKLVALTLDDGPTPGYTERALAVLREKRVHATFYLEGKHADRHPELVRAIAADGHEIGNHSYSHMRMVFLPYGEVKREVEGAEAALRRAGYTAPLTFRPPYGKKLGALPYYLHSRGIVTVTWDVEPETDPAVGADAQRIVRQVAERVRPGSIILLHVMFASRAPSAAALPQLIDALRKQGYEFATVSALMAAHK
jgi:peptidoglycan/xylan/chitin deacetylase (PgdA/CDA1 family)